MLIIDDLIPLRLYPAKRKVFIPFNEKDKKHGSAIFLMGINQEENEKLMNMRYVYDPSKLFKSYYIDRNVMAYIDSDAINRIEDEEEEFDELQEAVLSEGIIHTNKAKLVTHGGSTMDNQAINSIYNGDRVDSICRSIGLKGCPVDMISVKFYTSPSVLQKMSPYGYQAYSFYDDTSIHLLSQTCYDADSMDGPYEYYCLNELICFLLSKGYPNVSPTIYRAIAMALSGQVEYFRENEDKEEFKYMDSKKEGIDSLYFADLIYDAYKAKGTTAIRRILAGDFYDIRKTASSRMIKQAKDLYNKYYQEATLTAEQRKNLKDSDYGLPDKKKYPMPDADHVRAAIRFFNHCDKEDEARLAKAIKSKMKKYKVSADIGKDNRLSNYITEDAMEDLPVANYPGLEYSHTGDIFMGNLSKSYYDVLAILDTFTMDEFKKVSFYSTYKNNKYIAKRIIHYDENDYPESFMDIYHFPSEPYKAQITTGVAAHARGKHLVQLMFNEFMDSGWAQENNVTTLIWHANPENTASIKIATGELGFKGNTDKLDKYGRYTFYMHIDPIATTDTNIPMPEIDNESGIMINESAGFIFTEADSKYDRKIKKYLYKERLRNASQVLSIYDQIKSRNPKIIKTFRNIKQYRGLNLYVDTSYYHELYLKNAPRGNKRTLYMYFDFVSRLMENEDVSKNYSKITYFFPIRYTRNGNNLDNLLDWGTDLNIFSVMVYMVKRDPEVLKRWSNKTIIFLGDNGYFKIDFSKFAMNKLPKFKKNLKKILSKEDIPDIDEDEDDLNQTSTSSKGNAIGVISTIEKNTGIDIDNVSAVDTINLAHLSMNDTEPKDLVKSPEGTAILIIDSDSEAVISDIKSDALKSKEINAFYKMK